MRDAIDIIGQEIKYKDEGEVIIDSFKFVPNSNDIYITLKNKHNQFINVLFEDLIYNIKHQLLHKK